MNYQIHKEKALALAERLRPVLNHISKVPEPATSGFNFARLRFFSGWSAVGAFLFSHIFTQYALSTCAANFFFTDTQFDLSSWLNPFSTINHIMMAAGERSEFQSNFIALASVGTYRTLTTLAGLLFWIGLLAAAIYGVLRVSVMQSLLSSNASKAPEKKCPSCAEIIKLEAMRCRFCGHEFSASKVQEEVEAHHIASTCSTQDKKS